MQEAIESAKTEISKATSFMDIAKVFQTLFRVAIPGQEPPKTNTDYKDGNSDYGLKVSGIKTRERINEQAKEIISRVDKAEDLTADEVETLKQYSGRGGLTENSQFEYYTPQHVAEGCWDTLKVHGFTGGNVCDPSTGHGMFPATKTEGVVITGCDIDPTSSQVAQLLNPNDKIENKSFEKLCVDTPDNTFDAVITNVPFGDARGRSKFDDPAYQDEKKLERYFITRSIDKVRPGGLCVFVVPINIVGATGRQWERWRLEISKKAEFLGAHKLPSGTFKAQGTDTVTDVVVFKKHPESLLDKANDLPIETLKSTNVVWDSFIKGRYWLSEGKPYIMGKYVPKVDGDRWSREAVDSDIDDATLKQKLAAHFDSRIDWEALDVAAPIVRNYSEGDRKYMNGVEWEFDGTNWHKVMDAKVLTTIDADKYGAGTVEELKEILSTPAGALKLSAEQAFEVYKAFPDLMTPLQSDSIQFAMSQKPELAEQLWRGSIIGGMIGRYENSQKDGAANDLERLQLQEIITAEIDRFGHPKNNKKLTITGESARMFGFFANAVDEKGNFSDLLNGTLDKSGRILEFDSTNVQAIVEHLFVREGIQNIELEDIKKIYTGTMKIDSLGDLADIDGIAISADGMVIPWGRFTTGDIYPKLDAMQMAMAGETDKRILAKWEKQLQGIYERRRTTPPENITFGFQNKWYSRKYIVDFLKESGYKNVEYGVWTDVEQEDPLTGKMTTKKEFVEDYENPFGEFKGLDVKGFDNQFMKYLNGGNVTSSDAERIDEYKRRVRDIEGQFNAWIKAHPDIDQLGEQFNRKFNGYTPFEHEQTELGLQGISERITPHGYQNAAVRRLSESGAGILALDVGLGKAQPLDANILTPTGWKLMGDIKVGDQVIAADGRPTTVTGVFPQGEKEIFEVTFSDGTATECCDDHLWFTKTEKDRQKERYYASNGKDKPKTGSVKSLREIRGSLLRSMGRPKNHEIPMVGPVSFDSAPVDIDPYLLGAIIGDGSTRSGGLEISNPEPEMIGYLCEAMPQGISLKRESNGDRCPSYRLSKMGGHENVLLKSLKKIGLFGKLSVDKFVPDSYKFNTVAIRIELLRGLMDTDGYVSKDGITVQFSTSSEQLSNDVVFIVQSLGGNATISTKIPKYTHNGEKREGQLHYTVSMRMPPTINPFRIPRKAEKVKPKEKYVPVRFIMNVEPVGTKSAQCIMVDHPEHLYVTDEFIVTHNTLSSICLHKYNMQMGRSKRTCIAVPKSVLSNWYHENRNLLSDMSGVFFVGIENKKDKQGNFEKEPLYNEDGTAKVDKEGNQIFQDVLTDSNDAQSVFEQMWQIPQSNYSLVVMTFEKFGSIPMKPESRNKYVDQMVSRNQIAEKGSGEFKKVSYAEAKGKLKKEEEFASDGTKKKGELPYFEDMGFTDVIIDESHAFKNSMKGGDQTSGIAYISNPTVSKRGVDMNMKMNYLRDTQNGRGAYMLTATPLTNSPLEIYNMLNFVAPFSEFERFGVYNVDDFVRVFGDIQSIDKLMLSGEIKSKDGLVGFQNLDGLRNLFFKYVYQKTAKDFPDQLKLPEQEDVAHTLPLAADQESIYEGLKVEASDAANPKTKKDARPVFSILRDMERVATDLDLYNKTMTFVFQKSDKDKAGKLIGKLPAHITVKRVPTFGDPYYDDTLEEQKPVEMKIMLKYEEKETADTYTVQFPDAYEQAVVGRMAEVGINEESVAHPLTPKYAKLIDNCKSEWELGGKQIIFTEEKTQHEKIVRILVHHIPAMKGAIGIINADEASGDKLQQIADSYNSGKFRFIVANKKAEVGVNLQKGTTAIHHLTFPWTPASIQQRNGRGVRQGNKAKRVRVYYYQAGFDAYKLELLNKKSTWINDILKGDAANAENGSIMDGSDIQVMLSNNPEEAKRRIMEQQAAKAKAAKAAADRQSMITFQKIANNKGVLLKLDKVKADRKAWLEEKIPKLDADVARWKEKGLTLPEGDQERKTLGQKIIDAQETVAKYKNELANLDQFYEARKNDIEAGIRRDTLSLKARSEKEGLPFDKNLLDSPENVVITPKGAMLSLGEMYEVTSVIAEKGRGSKWNNGSYKAIIKVKSFSDDRKNAIVEVITGSLKNEWRGSAAGQEATYSVIDFFDSLSPVKVSYSEDEIRIKELLSSDHSYKDLVDGTISKEVFQKHYAEIRWKYSSDYYYLMNESGGYAFSSSVLSDQKVVYPDKESETFKKTLCEVYLSATRQGNGYAPGKVLQAIFGSDYGEIAMQYGNTLTQDQAIAEFDQIFTVWVANLSDRTNAQILSLIGSYSSDGVTNKLGTVINKGDNSDEISNWRYSYLSAKKAEYVAKVEDDLKQVELAKQEEIKNDPNYKEVPENVKQAFAAIGITVKTNTTEMVIPGFKGRGGTRVNPFSKWYFNDVNGKSGKLYHVKDILKARYGAAFFSDAGGDFDGAWWHIPVSTDLADVYKLMA